ncbi:methyltransferase type 12 [Aestuariivirga litoralis]|uniref:Methyltransferase type 12 n=1 Tax=Aestuariivirga litoralis TaxID=2650924 RepID=A0A2W2BRN9_9HYPH|nr:class I SAM-dependent methyltransferase [Aestuariivirga litoralis]PZF78367.1 methyltransferase type 12 [Aestuariivirga litoralis]
MSYIGNELASFALATTWRSYWSKAVRPYLGRTVLEVGAGIGSATWSLKGEHQERWIALEPDSGLAGQLQQDARRRNVSNLEVVCGTLDDLPEHERFDSTLYIDVIEHIRDDSAEIEKAAKRLKPGGFLIVLVPAHQFLFSEFDAAIGHYRRYDRAALRNLRPKSCEEVFVRYLDSVGLLASLGNRMLLHSGAPSSAQIRFWDRNMVPVSRVLDPLLGHAVGKSLLAVWRRTAPEGSQEQGKGLHAPPPKVIGA